MNLNIDDVGSKLLYNGLRKVSSSHQNQGFVIPVRVADTLCLKSVEDMKSVHYATGKMMGKILMS